MTSAAQTALASQTDVRTIVAGGIKLGIATAVGVVVRVRREATSRVRSEQARRAVSEERLQMAQEVHDGVGHGLAVIAMQAGVALRVLERVLTDAPELQRVREALEAGVIEYRPGREDPDALALMDKLSAHSRQRWPLGELPAEWNLPGLLPEEDHAPATSS